MELETQVLNLLETLDKLIDIVESNQARIKDLEVKLGLMKMRLTLAEGALQDLQLKPDENPGPF